MLESLLCLGSLIADLGPVTHSHTILLQKVFVKIKWIRADGRKERWSINELYRTLIGVGKKS